MVLMPHTCLSTDALFRAPLLWTRIGEPVRLGWEAKIGGFLR